jgi:hypothetical protein
MNRFSTVKETAECWFHHRHCLSIILLLVLPLLLVLFYYTLFLANLLSNFALFFII